MLFWVLAAILTFLAAVAVMLPFLRKAPAMPDSSAHDLEVYRDQLDEVQRDADRGLIGETEAETARAEIGRRILKIADSGRQASDAGTQRSARLLAVAAILAVPLLSWGIYLFTGSPQLPSQPLHARLGQDPNEASIDDLIARAENHLSKNPGDARGWQVLVPVYMRLGRYGDAELAYRNLLSLQGEQADLRAGLGEALVGKARGLVTREAEEAFIKALEIDPSNAKSRFYRATAHAQEGRTDEARKLFQEIMEAEPEGSPWRGTARQALANLSQGDEAPLARSDGAVSKEQQAMILGMVEGLDARLTENPDDLEGWQRLIRSYTVLQKPEEAARALSRAIAAFGEETEEAVQLRVFAAQLGVHQDQ